MGKCRAKFLPDEYAPKCRDHRGTLAESVGNCEAGPPGGDEVQRHARSPDHAAQRAGHVCSEVPGEVVAEADRGADHGSSHREDIPDEALRKTPAANTKTAA